MKTLGDREVVSFSFCKQNSAHFLHSIYAFATCNHSKAKSQLLPYSSGSSLLLQLYGAFEAVAESESVFFKKKPWRLRAGNPAAGRGICVARRNNAFLRMGVLSRTEVYI